MSSIPSSPELEFLQRFGFEGEKPQPIIPLYEGVSGKAYLLSFHGGRDRFIAKLYHSDAKKQFIDNESKIIEFLKNNDFSNVYRPLKMGYWQGRYVSFQHYAGPDLYEKFVKKKEEVSLGNIQSIAHQVLKALSQLHKRGICHLDIAPQNICMDKKGEVTLIDFSHAQKGSENPNKGVVCGARYRPPENYAYGKWGSFTDIWALGSVLFELYTKKRFIQDADKTPQGKAKALFQIWHRLGGNNEDFQKQLLTFPEEIRKVFDLASCSAGLVQSYQKEIWSKERDFLLAKGVFLCFLYRMFSWKDRASAEDLLKDSFFRPDWDTFTVLHKKKIVGMRFNIFCKETKILLDSRVLGEKHEVFKLPKALAPFVCMLLNKNRKLIFTHSCNPKVDKLLDICLDGDEEWSLPPSQNPSSSEKNSLQEEKMEIA